MCPGTPSVLAPAFHFLPILLSNFGNQEADWRSGSLRQLCSIFMLSVGSGGLNTMPWRSAQKDLGEDYKEQKIQKTKAVIPQQCLLRVSTSAEMQKEEEVLFHHRVLRCRSGRC